MIPIIRKKMTLSENEQKDLQLGNIHSHKQTNTWKKAETYYNTFANTLQQYGEVKHKMWFDDSTNACKMQFEIVKTNDKFDQLLANYLKDAEKKFDEIMKQIDPIFEKLSKEIDEKFKKIFGDSGNVTTKHRTSAKFNPQNN